MGKLVGCKSCGMQVDNSARLCPNCGVSNPGIKGWIMALVILGIPAAIAAVTLFNSVDESEPVIEQSDSPALANRFDTISVSDYALTINDNPSVSIAFGESQTNFCTASIYRAPIAQGYSVVSNQKSTDSMNMECNWNGKYFVESSKHPTSTKLTIVSLDNNKKLAVVDISLKLVEPMSNQYFSLDNVQINIAGDKFDNLVKKI